MAITRLGTALLGGLIAVVLAGGVATAAVRGTGNGSSDKTTSAPPLTSPAATPSITRTPAPPNAELLIPPSAYAWVPDSTAGTGPVDIAKAARLDGSGALSKVGFERLGFQHGVTRQWQNGQNVLVDLVYTFASPSGAQSYTTTAIAARKGDPTFTAATAPAGLPAGTAVFNSGSATARSVVAVFADGRRSVVIGLIGTTTPPDVSELVTLAGAQAMAVAGS